VAFLKAVAFLDFAASSATMVVAVAAATWVASFAACSLVVAVARKLADCFSEAKKTVAVPVLTSASRLDTTTETLECKAAFLAVLQTLVADLPQ
jgi:hypothetical protein